MNDEEVMTAVRESFATVRPGIPMGQIVRGGQARRRRHRAYGAACAAGAVALAGVTAAAMTTSGGTVPAVPGTLHTLAPAASASGGGVNLTAWTVTTGPGGTVNVTIRQLLDPAGLERTLRADGIPANVAFRQGEPELSPPLPPQCKPVAMPDEANASLQEKILGGMPDLQGGIALTIHRPAIPKGIGIYLAVQSGSGNAGWGWGLDLVKATPACTG